MLNWTNTKYEIRFFEHLLDIISANSILQDRIGEIGDIEDAPSFITASFSLILGSSRFPQTASNDLAVAHYRKNGLPHLKANPLSEKAIFDLAVAAEIDPYCLMLTKGWIAFYLRNGKALPAALLDLSIRLLHGKGPKFKAGRKPKNDAIRNLAIKAVATLALRKFDLRLDRNPASNHASLAYLIANALAEFGENVTESAVSKIARQKWETFDFGEIPVGKIAAVFFPTP